MLLSLDYPPPQDMFNMYIVGEGVKKKKLELNPCVKESKELQKLQKNRCMDECNHIMG